MKEQTTTQPVHFTVKHRKRLLFLITWPSGMGDYLKLSDQGSIPARYGESGSPILGDIPIFSRKHLLLCIQHDLPFWISKELDQRHGYLVRVKIRNPLLIKT